MGGVLKTMRELSVRIYSRGEFKLFVHKTGVGRESGSRPDVIRWTQITFRVVSGCGEHMSVQIVSFRVATTGYS